MIGRLRGTLAEKGLDHVILDVGGVGYVVTVSDRVLAGLPGERPCLFIPTSWCARTCCSSSGF